jgi:hypothetical protein
VFVLLDAKDGQVVKEYPIEGYIDDGKWILLPDAIL